VALAAACLALRLGDHALIDPDEGRTAATALAMAASGDYLVPTLNGLPHLDKPALFYAAEALAMRGIGPSELAARLPALLSAWGTIALTAWFSAHLFGRATAWIAGTAAATAPLTIAMARTALFDGMLSFFIVLALVAFFRAIEDAGPPSPISRRRRWALLAWAAMALGVLTKGPVALAVPLLVAGPYALARRRSAVVWHPSGWLLHLLIVLPWALAVEARVSGFLRYALVTETWGRLATGELRRGGPVWYFLPCLLIGCLPWILIAAAAGVERWREAGWEERPRLLFLALWIVVPLLFFSLSQSKRPQYILPLVPAVAVLTAWAWSGSRPPARAIPAAAIAWLVLGGLLLWAASDLGPRLGEDRDVTASARSAAHALGALMPACGVGAWLLSRRREASLAVLSLPLIMVPVVTAPLARDVARVRSAKDLAAELRPHLTENTRIVGIETFSPSLSFYLGRPIHLSSSTGEPLRSNYLLHTYGAWVGRASSTLHPPGWWWEALHSCSEPLLFLLKSRYQAERSILQSAGLPVLFEDHGLLAMGPCRGEAGREGQP
jgi:4-amino-4-deoxy-L-arabinose transferase-like glycosyltransferase